METSDTVAHQDETDIIRQQEAVVSTYETALLRYATGIVNNAHAAQDVVQNTFIKFFRRWNPGSPPAASMRNLLFRMTHNEAVDYIRRESRLLRLHRDHARQQTITDLHGDDPGQTIARQREEVLAQLRNLNSAEQQIILLRLQEELSYEEISHITGRSIGNVGCLLHHAVKKLSRKLNKEGQAAIQNAGPKKEHPLNGKTATAPEAT